MNPSGTNNNNNTPNNNLNPSAPNPSTLTPPRASSASNSSSLTTSPTAGHNRTYSAYRGYGSPINLPVVGGGSDYNPTSSAPTNNESRRQVRSPSRSVSSSPLNLTPILSSAPVPPSLSGTSSSSEISASNVFSANVTSPQGTTSTLVRTPSASQFTVNVNSGSERVTHDVRTTDGTGIAIINTIFDSEGLVENSEELKAKIAGIDTSLRALVGKIEELKKDKKSGKDENKDISSSIDNLIKSFPNLQAALDAALDGVAQEATSKEILAQLAAGNKNHESIQKTLKDIKEAVKVGNADSLESLLEEIKAEYKKGKENETLILSKLDNLKSSKDEALADFISQQTEASNKFEGLFNGIVKALQEAQTRWAVRDNASDDNAEEDNNRKLLNELKEEERKQSEYKKLFDAVDSNYTEIQNISSNLLASIKSESDDIRKYIESRVEGLGSSIRTVIDNISLLEENLSSNHNEIKEDLTEFKSQLSGLNNLILGLYKKLEDLGNKTETGFKGINGRLDNTAAYNEREKEIILILNRKIGNDLVKVPTTIADVPVEEGKKESEAKPTGNNASSSSSSSSDAAVIVPKNVTNLLSFLDNQNTQFITNLRTSFQDKTPNSLAGVLAVALKDLNNEVANECLSQIAHFRAIYLELISTKKKMESGDINYRKKADEVAGKLINFVNENPGFPEFLDKLGLIKGSKEFDGFKKMFETIFEDVKKFGTGEKEYTYASCDIETLVRSDKFKKRWESLKSNGLKHENGVALFFFSDNAKTISIVRSDDGKNFEILTTKTPDKLATRNDLLAVAKQEAIDPSKALKFSSSKEFGRYTLIKIEDKTIVEGLKRFKGTNTFLALEDYYGNDVFYRGVYSIVKSGDQNLNLTVNQRVTDNAKRSEIAPISTHYNVTIPGTCGLLSRNVHLNKHCGVESLGGGNFRLAPPGLEISEVEINNNGSVERAKPELLKNLEKLGIYNPEKEREIKASLIFVPRGKERTISVRGFSKPKPVFDGEVIFKLDQDPEKVIHKTHDDKSTVSGYSNRDLVHILKFLYGYYEACNGKVQNKKGLTSSGAKIDPNSVVLGGDSSALLLAVKNFFESSTTTDFNKDSSVKDFIEVENNKKGISNLLNEVNEVLSGKKVAKDGVLVSVDEKNKDNSITILNPFKSPKQADMHNMSALSPQEAAMNEISAFKAIVRYNDLTKYLIDTHSSKPKNEKEAERLIDGNSDADKIAHNLRMANFQSERPSNRIEAASADKVDDGKSKSCTIQ